LELLESVLGLTLVAQRHKISGRFLTGAIFELREHARNAVVEFTRNGIPVPLVVLEARVYRMGEVSVSLFGFGEKSLDGIEVGGVSGDSVHDVFCGCQRCE
jgi:hypothetical protein